MVSTPITSVFDAAKWFLTIGEKENEYIPPLKLNLLLYLAQAYYASAKSGMKLMPAYFVAHDIGPIDPNLYRALEQKNFNVFYEKITGEALLLLKGIWKKYGHIPVNDLANLLKSHLPYRKSYSAKEHNNEIPLSLMASFYGVKKKTQSVKQETVTRKMVLTQNGNVIVNLKKWTPRKKETRNG